MESWKIREAEEFMKRAEQFGPQTVLWMQFAIWAVKLVRGSINLASNEAAQRHRRDSGG